MFHCKPLMPKNPLKRFLVIFNYLKFNNKKKDHEEYFLPVNGDIYFKVGDSNYKIISFKKDVIYTVLITYDKQLYKKLNYRKFTKTYEEKLNIVKKTE
ncbi:hypothetical protein J2S14_003313 [Lederbergia wuyishanensis]|uniref:Uncharacterized protein n=1 Tax=Lederbergia wuyishanensis TaxID=1347903 RepID=A0ABU0D7X8_9BACI|nr:hypothetical protein [Lederbergia wuyishanensis]